MPEVVTSPEVTLQDCAGIPDTAHGTVAWAHAGSLETAAPGTITGTVVSATILTSSLMIRMTDNRKAMLRQIGLPLLSSCSGSGKNGQDRCRRPRSLTSQAQVPRLPNLCQPRCSS